MKKLFLLLSVTLVLVACAATNKTITDADLMHHHFALQTFNGERVYVQEPERRPYLEFNENMHINGVICNFFNGTAQLNGKILTAFTASTMMICPDSNLSEVENAFFAAITQGAELNLLPDGILTMKHSHNTFVFQRKDYVN